MNARRVLILTNFFTLLCFNCKDSVTQRETTKVSIETVNEEDSEKLVDDLMAQIDSL